MTTRKESECLVPHNKPIYLPKELADKLESLTRPYLDESGREVLNPVPMEIPIGLRSPLSLQDQIRRLLRQEVSSHAAAQGMETFDESDDFDVDDSGFDLEPSSKYEAMEDEMPDPNRRRRSTASSSSESSVDAAVQGPGEVVEPPVAPSEDAAK